MTRRRQILLRILLPLIVFLTAELLLRYVFDFRARLSLAERRTLAAYSGKPWAAQYFKDLAACASQSAHAHYPRYARYVLQDINEDCTTQFVNYSGRVRRTWNPTPPPGTPVYEIAMFGGSTMEGLGAVDDETIPSQLSRLLNASTADGTVYHVTNFGVSGYTFTQSLMKLVTLLRDGRHFDAVIFYGGDNDIDYAYNLGEVGALEAEDLVRTRLEGSVTQRLRAFGKEQVNACVLCLAGVILARNTALLADHLTPYLLKLRDLAHFKKGQADGNDVQPFASGIARYYGQSHALLESVADAYHVRFLDVWQPSLMYDASYAPGEAQLARMDTRLSDLKLRQLYKLTRDQVVALKLTQFVDVSHVLDGRHSAAYLDAVHLSGDANAIVARSVYDAWKNESLETR
jgi:lysophospholipase L1-like esterase